MRCLPPFLSLLALLAPPVFAQTGADQQLPPDAKPPVMVPLDDSLEPQVTIKKRDGNTIEEHRINGRLYKITVTPENGIPYTLIDQRGDGSFSTDTQGTPGLSVPMWVIGTF
ncbi:DUF2782 domain-containing protein [Propionivibrio sp.]|uniref:DUF2782 domain-containing protein n=1 Tax=Propionivibrio sp. TaxID=2212460 RepID=UPI00260661B5|nr:DUF2782 domain-containing protein [Propionivibrio sp.]